MTSRTTLCRRHPFASLALGLVLFLTPALAPAPFSAARAETPEELLNHVPTVPTPLLRERLVSKYVAILLSKYHYHPQNITPAICSEWFTEYFNSLDFNRSLFLESDLEEFRSFETVLWDQRTMTANLEFPFKVYQRYLERARQRALFSIAAIDDAHDFSVREYINAEAKDLPWCKTMAELENQWRLQVKNALLVNQLQQEKDAARQQNAKPETDNAAPKQPETDNAAEPAAAELPALEPFPGRLAKNYARNYLRRAEVEAINILEIYLTALSRVLDPHSAYMAPETKENFDINMRLSLEGIGATLSTKDAYTVIVGIVPGGPADRDGRLKEGDRITAVAQEGEEPIDVIEMPLNKVVAKIRGPKGSTVHLTILEEGSSTPTLVSLVRDEVKLTDQEAQSETRQLTLPGDQNARVLVIYLPSFYADFAARAKGDPDYKSSARDIRKLIEQAMAEPQQPDGIILDLRGNGGGALDEAVELAGLFIPSGPVVQVRDSGGKIDRKEDKNPAVTFNGPLIVMVDKLSASASEIVAAALQDYGRAVIVGDGSTHGKGTVQSVINLANIRALSHAVSRMPDPEPGSLKITISKFYRINGSSTQVRGVTSDITFPSFLDQLDLGEDKLPHVLPWDQIKPLEYTALNQTADVLPALLQASLKRRQDNPLFREYLGDIDFYAAFRAQKQLPLELQERRQHQENEEKSVRMFRKFQAQRKNARRKSTVRSDDLDDLEVPDAQDLILEETINIMADFIQADRQTPPAPVPAPAPVVAMPPERPEGP
ncbi:MAG: carboxy terminal-processing peptidase [Lentisphaeria bacterium]|nr:carboxy terminal-processing peptidase [Lentisphaeria bacterium]